MIQEFFEEKNNRAVLLLHAYTGSSNDVRLLARFLVKHGYTVYAPNFKGHTTNRVQDLLECTPQDWYQDTKDAYSLLKQKGYEQITVLGLSMGGLMATALAEEVQESSLIGVGVFCTPIIELEKNFLPLEKTFLAYANRRLTEQGDNVESELAKIRPKMYRQFQELADFAHKVEMGLLEIYTPFYIAQAGQDELIDPESAILLKEALPSSEVAFYWFEESSHVITIGRERMAFQESVLTFLEQLDWRC